MRKLIFSIVILLFFPISALAGTFPRDTFNDLEDHELPGFYLENWYSEAAHFWKYRKVILGINENFEAGKNVTRDQMAVLLKRFYDYLHAPMGSEWEIITNEFYSVQYPTQSAEARSNAVKINDCETGLMGYGDYVWFIYCFNNNDKTVLELFEEERSNEISQSIESFILNGYNAYHVTNVAPKGHVYQYVIVDAEEVFYKIEGSGKLFDPAFELFYKSFKVL